MPENMIFESGGVVAYVLDDQVLRWPVLQSRRRSGRASAGKDIGAAGRVASEVDRRRVFLRVQQETPDYYALLILRSSLLPDWPAIAPPIYLSSLIPVRHDLDWDCDMHAMDVDTVVDLPGGDNYEDVTQVFAEAANGGSCAHYVSSREPDTTPRALRYGSRSSHHDQNVLSTGRNERVRGRDCCHRVGDLFTEKSRSGNREWTAA